MPFNCFANAKKMLAYPSLIPILFSFGVLKSCPWQPWALKVAFTARAPFGSICSSSFSPTCKTKAWSLSLARSLSSIPSHPPRSPSQDSNLSTVNPFFRLPRRSLRQHSLASSLPAFDSRLLPFQNSRSGRLYYVFFSFQLGSLSLSELASESTRFLCSLLSRLRLTRPSSRPYDLGICCCNLLPTADDFIALDTRDETNHSQIFYNSLLNSCRKQPSKPSRQASPQDLLLSDRHE